MVSKVTKNNGDDILYHFFQKQLMADNPDFAKSFIILAINALGIWIHPDFYLKLPVLLPFVVRDPSCRKNKVTGEDEWASPNSEGLLRDDNSLVKGIVKSMPVVSNGNLYKEGIALGNGFVASHIWRNTDLACSNTKLASRSPWLNTFIPNLVWLPKQISKMTDREGGWAQQYVQALSRHIYGRCSFKSPLLHERIRNLWSQLPPPDGFSDADLPDVSTLNFFEPREKVVTTRINKIGQVVAAIQTVLAGQPLDKKVISRRYIEGLPDVDHQNLSVLAANLQEYMDELK